MQEKPKFPGEKFLLGSGLFCAVLSIALYFSEPKTDYNEAASVYFQYLSYTCFVGASVVRVINLETPQISLSEYKTIQQKKENLGFREGVTDSEMPEYIKQIEKYLTSFKLNQSGYLAYLTTPPNGKCVLTIFEIYRTPQGKYNLFKVEKGSPAKKVDLGFSDGELKDKLVDDPFPIIHILSHLFTPTDDRLKEYENAEEVKFDNLFSNQKQ